MQMWPGAIARASYYAQIITFFYPYQVWRCTYRQGGEWAVFHVVVIGNGAIVMQNSDIIGIEARRLGAVFIIIAIVFFENFAIGGGHYHGCIYIIHMPRKRPIWNIFGIVAIIRSFAAVPIFNSFWF